MARIHKDDTVKIIAGKNKGTTGKVLKVNTKDQTVLVEGVGVGHRHIKPSQYNLKGGKKRYPRTDGHQQSRAGCRRKVRQNQPGWFSKER